MGVEKEKKIRIQSNSAGAQGPPGTMGGPHFDGSRRIIRTDSTVGSETRCYRCAALAAPRAHQHGLVSIQIFVLFIYLLDLFDASKEKQYHVES